MQAVGESPDFTQLDDPAFLDERARVRRLLAREPENTADRAALEQLYAGMTEEFLHRARIAWTRPAKEASPDGHHRTGPATSRTGTPH